MSEDDDVVAVAAGAVGPADVAVGVVSEVFGKIEFSLVVVVVVAVVVADFVAVVAADVVAVVAPFGSVVEPKET